MNQKTSKYKRSVPKHHFVNRSTQEGFLKYMLKNPYYFKEIFHCEPTKENIIREFALIKIIMGRL